MLQKCTKIDQHITKNLDQQWIKNGIKMDKNGQKNGTIMDKKVPKMDQQWTNKDQQWTKNGPKSTRILKINQKQPKNHNNGQK